MEKYLDAINKSHSRMEDTMALIDLIIDREVGIKSNEDIKSELVTDKDQVKECAVNTEILEGKLNRIADRLHSIIMGCDF